MAIQDGYGKVSGSESLVFAYDLKDTINSYKGEPTTNYFASFGIAMPNLSGANVTTTLPDGTTGTVFRVTVNSNSNTSRCSMGINLPNPIPQANVSYTVSHWIRTTGTVPVAAGWEAEVGSPDGYVRPSFESGYIGNYGSFTQPNDISSTWQRVSYTYSYSTTKTSNITPFIYFGSPIGGTQDTIGATIDFYGFQFEVNSHSTPYTTTSRSNTQSLFDLTTNSAVNTSGVSFNSSAIITFDGTNDKIDIVPPSTVNVNTGTTIVAVIRKTSTGYTGQKNIISYRNGTTGGNLYIGSGSGGIFTYYDSLNSPAYTVGTIPDNQYVHIVVRLNNDGSISHFSNGVLGGTTSVRTGFNSQSNNKITIGSDTSTNEFFQGDIPVFKHYNKQLSDTEILNDYLKYKRQYGLT
jgi:hypothetical protein